MSNTQIKYEHTCRVESKEKFSKQILDMGNGKIMVNILTGCTQYISLRFLLIHRFIRKVFQNNAQNHKSWLSERAIFICLDKIGEFHPKRGSS